MSLFKLIFGSKNDRYLKKLRPIVREINALEPEVQKLRDEDSPSVWPSTVKKCRRTA